MEKKRSPKESDYLPKRGNPLQETVCYRLGGTVYEVHTSCGGTEPLYDKMVRLIRSEAIASSADKGTNRSIIRTATCLSGVNYRRNEP